MAFVSLTAEAEVARVQSAPATYVNGHNTHNNRTLRQHTRNGSSGANTHITQTVQAVESSPSQTQQQQQRSPLRRIYNSNSIHHFHHHHHYSHPPSASPRTPNYHPQQPQNNVNSMGNGGISSSNNNSYYYHPTFHRSPPSYNDLTLTPASATTGSPGSSVHAHNNGETGGQVTPSLSPIASPPLNLQLSTVHGGYRSSLPVPPPLRSLPAPTVGQSNTSTNSIVQTAEDPRTARTSSFQQQHQQQCYAEPSRRPEPRASLRRVLPPPLSVAAVVRHDSANRSSNENSNTGNSSPNTQHYSSAGGVAVHKGGNFHENSKAMRGVEEEELEVYLSTPVDQRIPAMVPPSYDAYNVSAAPVHNGAVPAASGMFTQRRRHRRRHCNNNQNNDTISGGAAGATRSTAGEPAATFASYQRSSSLKTMQLSFTSAQVLERTVITVTAPQHTTQQQPRQNLEIREEENEAAAHDVPTHWNQDADAAAALPNSATAAAAAAAAGSRFQSSHARFTPTPEEEKVDTDVFNGAVESLHRSAHADPAYSAVTNYKSIAEHIGGVSCGMSPSPSEWRSPGSSSGARNTWRHSQRSHQQQSFSHHHHHHVVTSSIDMAAFDSSNSYNEDELDGSGLLTASSNARRDHRQTQQQWVQYVTPFVTPSRAPALAQQLRFASSVEDTSVVLMSTVGDVSVGDDVVSCSTPRVLSSSHAPQRVGYNNTAGLVTPNAVLPESRTIILNNREEVGKDHHGVLTQRSSTPPAAVATQHTSTTANTTAITVAASTTTTSAAPPVFLFPFLAEATAGVRSTAHPSYPTAHLQYLNNADFLFAVDEDEEEGRTVMTMTTVDERTDGTLVTATPEAAPASTLSSPAGPSPSMYYSPQQLHQHDRFHAFLGSAITTPASGIELPSSQRHFHYYHNGTSNTLMTASSNWPDALFSSPAHKQATLTTGNSSRSGDGWNSPLQWNPRQAREDREMLAAKEVAAFALSHHRAVTSASPSPTNDRSNSSGFCLLEVPTQRTSPTEPSFSVGAAQTPLAGALSSVFPAHAARQLPVYSRAFSTGNLDGEAIASNPRLSHQHRLQVTQNEASLGSKEEAEAEWIEILLHYRDRENESSRIRHALEDASTAEITPVPAAAAATTAGTPTAATTAGTTSTTTTTRSSEAGDAVTSTTAAAAANAITASANSTSLAWWATSSLMRGGFTMVNTSTAGATAPRRSPSTQQSPLQQQNNNGVSFRVSMPPPPPALLCAAMSAASAGRTIARQVRRQLWRRRELTQRHRSAYLAARMPMYASKKEDSLR